MKLTKREFLLSSGIEGETLELWLEHSWLIPEQTAAGPTFSELDAARARLIIELRDNIGANEAGIDVILHLVDQLNGMRWALRQVGQTMAGQPARDVDRRDLP